jgi:enoyl-CoA hydratase/carnithine racemase
VSEPTVLYATDPDGIAWVTLNRPSVRNAHNVQMRDDLYEILSTVRDDSGIRVLVVRGAGRDFCAGADLTEFGTAPSPTAARRIRRARDVWALMATLETPSIAAIQGHAIGSGFETALHCDLRIATQSAVFAFPEVSLGMIPSAGGTQLLPRICGVGRALDLLLTGRSIGAPQAAAWGLVTKVVAPADLESETLGLARVLAALDSSVLRSVKRAVRAGLDLTLAQALELDLRAVARTAAEHGA